MLKLMQSSDLVLILMHQNLSNKTDLSSSAPSQFTPVTVCLFVSCPLHFVYNWICIQPFYNTLPLLSVRSVTNLYSSHFYSTCSQHWVHLCPLHCHRPIHLLIAVYFEIPAIASDFGRSEAQNMSENISVGLFIELYIYQHALNVWKIIVLLLFLP